MVDLELWQRCGSTIQGVAEEIQSALNSGTFDPVTMLNKLGAVNAPVANALVQLMATRQQAGIEVATRTRDLGSKMLAGSVSFEDAENKARTLLSSVLQA
ncbi:type VII secretion target [Tsukamurella hominis]|uniref:type VII secretion target n=1 Tax=Tsukamurella hominis TaxID=1970232 RepID=UPI0039E7DBB1